MDFKNEIPPPSYSQSELAVPEPDTSTTDTTSPSQPAPRTMHVYMTDWKGRSLRVMSDADSTGPSTMLYHVELHTTRKPHMTFRRPPANAGPDHIATDDPVLATVKFHTLHTHMDVELNGHALKLTPKSKLKMCDFEYDSQLLGTDNKAITWTSPTPLVVMNSTCLDAEQRALARTVPVQWAKRKAAKIEFADGSMAQEQIDEVVVTGLAFFYYRFLLSVGMWATIA